MSTEQIPLWVLPGMGATSEMYSGAWADLNHAQFINWPLYKKESTLKDVAFRIIDEYSISSPYIIIGSSLGGMVAQEIASIVPPEIVILLGSALDYQEVQSFLKFANKLIDWAPLESIQHLAGISSGNLGQQFQKTDPQFIRAMCKALPTWKAPLNPKVKTWRIHGEKDLVIPRPLDPETIIIPEAGHLLAITHAKECIREIQRLLKSA